MKRRHDADAEAMLEELKRAAATLGVEVRDEELLREIGYRPRSGFCRVHERDLILLDRRIPAGERVDALCAALTGYDLEGVFLSPALRARVAAARGDEGFSAR